MRTTLDIPEDLMDEARSILGFKSKTDVVVVALRELIRRKRIEELKGLAGKLELKVDMARSRRRKTGRKAS
jgi:Arc/MetJ family transcription regulator